MLCLKLTIDQADEVPRWLRRLLRLPEFQTKKMRMGKVAFVSSRSIQYYSIADISSISSDGQPLSGPEDESKDRRD
jgi:hypothetical protein